MFYFNKNPNTGEKLLRWEKIPINKNEKQIKNYKLYGGIIHHVDVSSVIAIIYKTKKLILTLKQTTWPSLLSLQVVKR